MPDSKRHFSTSPGSRACSRRSSMCSRRCTTIARSRIARIKASPTHRSRSRPASNGWCAATLPRAASCSRSIPSRAFATWCSSRRHTASARRSCRARSIPDEIYIHKPMLAAGKFPVIRRALGSKRGANGLHRRRMRPDVRRLRWKCRKPSATASASPMRKRSSSRATRSKSSGTTAGRWTSSGARMGATARSTSCKRVPRR